MSDMNPAAWLSGGLSAVGNIAEGVINQATQRETNAMQINLANTAIQRRQKDLAAAGINPLMAGKIGGAETPTLQAPRMTGLPEAGAAIGSIPKKAMELKAQELQNNKTAMDIELTKQDIESKKASASEALANALLAKANENKANVEAEWLPKSAQQHIKLEEQQSAESKAREAESQATTLTINMSRDPRIRMLHAQATSAEWQAKADQYLPDLNKAKLAIDNAEAKWAQVLGEAKARQADAMSKIIVNDLVKSGQLVDTEIAKAQTEFQILTSKAGQEQLAWKLAEATYGAKVTEAHVNVILKALQAASIGKDLIMPSAGQGINNSTWKAWQW